MNVQRHVRLFKNGRNQAVRIPREFEMPGEEVVMRKEGERLVLEPVKRRSLSALLASMDPIGEDIGPIERPPAEPFDL